MSVLKNSQLGMKTAGLAVMVGMLAACSHQNPLTKEPQNTQGAVVFLYTVANKAQPAIDSKYPQYRIHDGADFYILCMDNARQVMDIPQACEDFYKDMAEAVKTQKSSPYSGVNLADIKDATMWHTLQPAFETYQSNTSGYFSGSLPTKWPTKEKTPS